MSPEAGERHVPVLAEAVLAALAPAPGESYVDCTAGLGGHAALIAPRLGREGRVLLIDADPENLRRARATVDALPAPPAVEDAHSNFAAVAAVARTRGLSFDLLLADLGFSSNQMADPQRGFSFMTDGPLDMRLDPGLVGTAADLVNGLPERRLSEILFRFGEEPFAKAIARRIVAARETERITSTERLAAVVREAYGSRARSSRMNPATRTFMALRIAVNDELGALERLLASIADAARGLGAGTGDEHWLRPGARIAIISFHSLEDRLVKHAFRGVARAGFGTEPVRGPLTASEEEQATNPRSRSAKLRVLKLSGR